MKTIFLVTEEQSSLARRIEDTLLALPSESGILFVGVSVSPEEPPEPETYHVWIGCHRLYEESLVTTLVQHELRDLVHGKKVQVHPHRGAIRRSQKAA